MPRKTAQEPIGDEQPRRVRRRRKDPGDHPIDGDMRLDVVHNKRKDLEYLYLTQEDAEIWRQWGATKVQRSEDGPRPAFGFGDDSETDVKARGLTLYQIPKAVAAKRHASATAEANKIMKTIRKEARQSAGGEYEETIV